MGAVKSKLHDKPLAFIGPMGSGKSSLARRLSSAYGGFVFDVDREFSKRFGGIPEYFARFGEDDFRRREQDLLIEAAHSGADYIATGGGAVKSRRGMFELRSECDIVYLNAPRGELSRRIERSDRPLKNDLEKTLIEREPLYKKYADYTVDSSVDSVRELLTALKSVRKNRYDVILCDSDDTLLDFQKASAWSVKKAVDELGLGIDGDKAVELFFPIVTKVWGMLERNEITRAELFEIREDMFYEAIGEKRERGEFNTAYRKYLRQTKFVLDGAAEFLQSVRERGIKLYIITNADVYCASERLKPIISFMDGAFISEQMGCHKPDREYFDKVFEDIGTADKNRVLLIGDSETSDIAGGVDYGLDTCLFDPSGKKQTAADYRARDYKKILDVI